MALSDAVEMIADALEEEANAAEMKDVDTVDVGRILLGYARQLRIALKANAGAAPYVLPIADGRLPYAGSPGAQNYSMVEAAKADLRERKRKTEERMANEGLGPDGVSVVACVGGPADGTFIDCPAEVPAGSKTAVSGAVYIMGKDRKVHFSEEESKKLAEADGKKLIVP